MAAHPNGDRQAGRIRPWRGLLLAGALCALLPAAPALAQTPSKPAATGVEAAPAQVKALLNLLADPAVRAWLEQQQPARAAPPAAPPTPETTPSSYVAAHLDMIRQHLAALPGAAMKLPHEVKEAGNILFLEFQEQGIFTLLLLIAGFILAGFVTERLYQWAAAGVEKWIIGLKLDTVGDRLRAVGIRFGYGTCMVLSFALGSVGVFLIFDWSLLLKEIVLGYLLAFLALRMSLVFGRFLLAPGGERFRIVPTTTDAAWFAYRRLALIVGWFAFGWVTVSILTTFGFDMDARRLVAYMLGLVLLGLGIEMVWRWPGAEAPGDDAATKSRLGRNIGAALATLYFAVLWGLWVASAMPSFWLAVVIVGLPAAIRVTQRSVNFILRPPGTVDPSASMPSITAACLERGLRALLIIGATLLLAKVWHVDLTDLTARDTAFTRLMRGGLSAVVIVLVADFAWHLLKTLIDRKLFEAGTLGQADTEDARRQARLRTLLPIVRNILFIVLFAMAALMALSAMGVEIGPLIAAASVVGVAIGFGAQTLVRDIISGMFFLLDDAFRVGEYIQSGNNKGTVESFSLRSVKLRHHRGPLYTVPFGTLGAIQNMSRDWVIDKLSVGVTYDSDLDKVKKLIKQIGKELAEDPELKPNIIETLKMQGVEQFGDFAIQIRMKMMTKPGEQFVIRRKAFGLIKKAFDANGVQFAFPTVQVAGGPGGAAGDAIGAIARQGLEMTKAATES